MRVSSLAAGGTQPFREMTEALQRGESVTVPFTPENIGALQQLYAQHRPAVQKIEADPGAQLRLKSLTVKEDVARELNVAKGTERVEGAVIGTGVAGVVLSTLMITGKTSSVTPGAGLMFALSAAAIGYAVWPKLKDYLSEGEFEVGADGFTIKPGSLYGTKETTYAFDTPTPDTPASATPASLTPTPLLTDYALLGLGSQVGRVAFPQPSAALWEILDQPPTTKAGPAEPPKIPQVGTATFAALGLPHWTNLQRQLDAREKELEEVKRERDTLAAELTDLKARLASLIG